MSTNAIIIGVVVSVGGVALIVGAIFGLRIYCRRRKQATILTEQQEQREAFRLNHTHNLRGNLVQIKDCDVETDFELLADAELGKGGCGVVVVGVNKHTFEKYAIKIVDKSTADRNRLERELKLLKDVDHPNIVRLFSVYDIPEYTYFVMELCVGGHLGNLISRSYPNKYLPEERAKVLTRQLLSAVVHLHSRGIAHRDIKLQNILMDSGNDATAQVKLIDFGYGSRFIGALPMKTKCGTPYTTAPEVLRECYDERCDVWSCGVVVYIMLSGRRPFEALNINGPLAEAGKAAMLTNILAGRYHMNHESFRSVSTLGRKFVTDLLHVDYKTRLRSDEVLEHPWLSSLNHNVATNLYGNNAAGGQSPTSPTIHRVSTQSSHSSLVEKSQKAVSNMVKMSNSSELKRAGSMAMVFGFQPRQAVEMRAIFQSFDTDASGALTIDEFTKALNVISPELTNDDIRRVFHAVDINGDNQITYTEFLAATIDPLELDVGAVSRAFQLMDVNNDGYITAEELKKVLSVKFHEGSGGHGKGGNKGGKKQGKGGGNKKGRKSGTTAGITAGATSGAGGAGGAGVTAITTTTSEKKPDVPVFFARDPNNSPSKIKNKSLSVGMLARSASSAGKALMATGAKSMLNLLSNNNNNGKEDEEEELNGPGHQNGEGEEDSEEDIRVLSLEERIRDLMASCDVDNDGVISYAEFLWAMTGAKEALGDISALGPQKGDLPPDFQPVQRIPSVCGTANDQQQLQSQQQADMQMGPINPLSHVHSHTYIAGAQPLSLPDAVTIDSLLVDDNNISNTHTHTHVPSAGTQPSNSKTGWVSGNQSSNNSNTNNNNNNKFPRQLSAIVGGDSSSTTPVPHSNGDIMVSMSNGAPSQDPSVRPPGMMSRQGSIKQLLAPQPHAHPHPHAKKQSVDGGDAINNSGVIFGLNPSLSLSGGAGLNGSGGRASPAAAALLTAGGAASQGPKDTDLSSCDVEAPSRRLLLSNRQGSVKSLLAPAPLIRTKSKQYTPDDLVATSPSLGAQQLIVDENDLTEGAPRRVSTLIRQSSVKALLAPAPLTRGRSRSNFDTNNINEAINGSSENPGSLTTESSQRTIMQSETAPTFVNSAMRPLFGKQPSLRIAPTTGADMV